MPNPTLSGIFRYPVKSLRGEALPQASLDARGIGRDRHWMLVDSGGEFLSQRKHPRMALIQACLQEQRLILKAEEMPDLHVPREAPDDDRLDVRVWEDQCLAGSPGQDADEWLSEFLKTECRLVYMPQDQFRQVDMDFADKGDQTAFSDGFPLLLISEASLDDLNGRLPDPLPMTRFRPNLVVRGCEPYAEDSWIRIRIGSLEFRIVKPCSRCVITTVNPETAETGKEPLKTLTSYRRMGKKVYFGQNLVHSGAGELAVGAEIELLETGKSNLNLG